MSKSEVLRWRMRTGGYYRDSKINVLQSPTCYSGHHDPRCKQWCIQPRKRGLLTGGWGPCWRMRVYVGEATEGNWEACWNVVEVSDLSISAWVPGTRDSHPSRPNRFSLGYLLAMNFLNDSDQMRQLRIILFSSMVQSHGFGISTGSLIPSHCSLSGMWTYWILTVPPGMLMRWICSKTNLQY